jgi:hypothetical protein
MIAEQPGSAADDMQLKVHARHTGSGDEGVIRAKGTSVLRSGI